MLDAIISAVCRDMESDLTQDQIRKLESIMYIHMADLRIEEECYDLEVVDADNDAKLVREFLASKRISGRADSTLEQYRAEIWKCRTAIGKSFKDITTADLKAYLGIQKEYQGNSLTTINNKRRYLNSFFSYLSNEGRITGNPVSRIEAIKEPHKRKRAYTTEDLEAMRAKCGHVRDRALLEFLLATGLRVSEASSLTVGQIDLYKQTFTVVGKGNKERRAYISDTAMYHLSRYLQWRMQREQITWEQLKERPLFATIKAPFSQLENNGIRCALKRIGAAAEVMNVHPHRFRRTFASEASHRQIPLEDLKELMGHTKLDTTLLYIDNERDIESSYRKYIA